MTTSDPEQKDVEGAVTRLLAELRDGEDVAIVSVYPGAGALEGHAVAYLSNAQMLCTDACLPDFAVFTALYNMRHGLELWFKGVVARTRFDRAARAIAEPGSSFASVVDAVGCTGKGTSALRKALCVLRNITQDRLPAPACREKRINNRYADKAVAFLRSESGKGNLQHLPTSWTVPTGGHDLAPLWKAAGSDIESVFDDARYHLVDVDGAPMSIDRIASVVALFAAVDPEGDAFRYPASLSGDWNVAAANLALSLAKLKELARELEDAVRYYRSAANQGIRWWSPMPKPWD